MKNYLSIHFAALLTSLYCLFPGVAFAQTFSFGSTDTIQYAGPGTLFSCQDSLVNHSSTGFYVDAIRLVNDTAPEWQTSICLDICYPPFIDSARVYISPNTSQLFVLDFTPSSTPDTSIVLMKFINVLNPSNVVYQKFYGITVAGMGMQDVSECGMDVRFIPSPAISGSVSHIQISEQKSKNEDFSLVIYDIYGKAALRLNNLKNGDNYLTLHLPVGAYVYELITGNGSRKTGKLLVAR